MSLPQVNTSLLSNETQQREKYKELAELEHIICTQKMLFREHLQTLQSQTQEWIKKFIIRAPIEGKLNFISPIQENSYFPINKLIGYVSPSATSCYAEIFLPQNNFGKIRTGQSVLLRFDAYPYQEFGYVKGTLDYITDFATDSGFSARIQLPKGLLTTQFKKLRYQNGLKAEARIITMDMRLLKRFFNEFLKVFDK